MIINSIPDTKIRGFKYQGYFLKFLKMNRNNEKYDK